MNFINNAFNLFPMYIYKNIIVDTPSIPSLPSLPSFPIETPYVPTAQLPLEALEKAKSLGAQLCASLSREQLCADFSNGNDYFAKPIQLLCSLDIPLTAKVCFGGLVKTGDYVKYAGLALVVMACAAKVLSVYRTPAVPVAPAAAPPAPAAAPPPAPALLAPDMFFRGEADCRAG